MVDKNVEEWRRGVDEVRRGEATADSLIGIGNVLADEIERLLAELAEEKNTIRLIAQKTVDAVGSPKDPEPTP